MLPLCNSILYQIVSWVVCICVWNQFGCSQPLYLIEVYVSIMEDTHLKVVQRPVQLIKIL